MSNWDGCWVISTKNPYECWLIDNDERKPIYLKDDYPQYDRQKMFEYRLANQPTEEYLEKHPPSKDWDGQMHIEDWLRENGGEQWQKQPISIVKNHMETVCFFIQVVVEIKCIALTVIL